MTVVELLRQLWLRGIELHRNGDRLRVTEPHGKSAADLRPALIEHKGTLLELLRFRPSVALAYTCAAEQAAVAGLNALHRNARRRRWADIERDCPALASQIEIAERAYEAAHEGVAEADRNADEGYRAALNAWVACWDESEAWEGAR